MTGLVEAATGTRHAMVRPPAAVPPSASHVPGIHHASSPFDDDPFRSAGGGVARDPESAATAAVAEALERWPATVASLPLRRSSQVAPDDRITLGEFTLHDHDQRADPEFPHTEAYPADPWLTEVFDLRDNTPVWVPAALVSLTTEHGALATSSGLAADPSVCRALLRATQELIERDAYITTWLHQLGGREVATPGLTAEVAPFGGEVRAFDCTQSFSPHPVALVTGTLPLAGAARHSLGVACRGSWEAAVERAFLEMLQGIVFVGHHLSGRSELVGMPAGAVHGFDEHAIYYTANPDRWDDVPLLRHAVPATAPRPGHTGAGDLDGAAALHHLVDTLDSHGIRLAYRELTSEDCSQVGLRVVRVLSPELTPLHHEHRWPFLGGTTPDVEWRYPDAVARQGDRRFPSPHPHALG